MENSPVLKKRKRCSRTFHCKRCKCKGDGYMVPDEIWGEILTRLPIKSLLKSRTVCTSWNILGSNISRHKMRSLPQCGLFLGFLESYICLKTSKTRNLYTLKAPDECVLSSGYDKGNLADIDFDFGDLFKNAPWECESIEGKLLSCTVSRGLVIFRSDDGELHVKNPATKEVVVVPKSSRSERTGWKNDTYLIIRGLETGWYSDLMILRYIKSGFAVECYSNSLGDWFGFLAVKDDDIRGSTTFITDSCVTIKINGRRLIYVLTDLDFGIVIKFPTLGGIKPVASRLQLPPETTVNEQGGLNPILGRCGGECLYLSHLNAQSGCLSVWKHNYDESSWILLRRINITRRLKVVTGADEPLVSNLGFHEDELIVYISTKSSIFSYSLADDSLNLMVQLNVEDSKRFLDCDREPPSVVPFTPFLGSLISPNIINSSSK